MTLLRPDDYSPVSVIPLHRPPGGKTLVSEKSITGFKLLNPAWGLFWFQFQKLEISFLQHRGRENFLKIDSKTRNILLEEGIRFNLSEKKQTISYSDTRKREKWFQFEKIPYNQVWIRLDIDQFQMK